jgi:hypothetical protein
VLSAHLKSVFQNSIPCGRYTKNLKKIINSWEFPYMVIYDSVSIKDIMCIYNLIIILHDLNSSMRESQTFRRIFAWFIYSK